MNIQFTIKNEQILLRADSLNYELCKIITRKDEVTGKDVEGWMPIKYFASLPQALNKIIDMKVRSSDAVTLKQLATDLKSAREEVNRAWSVTV
jgi:hypothetical protein